MEPLGPSSPTPARSAQDTCFPSLLHCMEEDSPIYTPDLSPLQTGIIHNTENMAVLAVHTVTNHASDGVNVSRILPTSDPVSPVLEIAPSLARPSSLSPSSSPPAIVTPALSDCATRRPIEDANGQARSPSPTPAFTNSLGPPTAVDQITPAPPPAPVFDHRAVGRAFRLVQEVCGVVADSFDMPTPSISCELSAPATIHSDTEAFETRVHHQSLHPAIHDVSPRDVAIELDIASDPLLMIEQDTTSETTSTDCKIAHVSHLVSPLQTSTGERPPCAFRKCE